MTILSEFMDIYFFLGGYDDSSPSKYNDDILEYDPETKEWIQIGTRRESKRRGIYAVSVVKYSDYSEFCQ